MAIAMGLTVAKGEIDYRLFAKDEYSAEEKAEIVKYLRADVEITKQMFDKLYAFWLPFTDLLSYKNIKNWSWLRCSIASLVYKSACKLLNIEEEYSDGIAERGVGALVIEPTVEEAWDVYYVDVVSLYPHIFAMFNLMAEKQRHDYTELGIENDTNTKLWHGNSEFKVKGYYDISKQQKMSVILMDMLQKRIELKGKDKNNPLIYTYKIFLNTYYGAVRNPVFKNIHTENAGSDCCIIGQQVNRIMQRMFAAKGYSIIAGDTDSNFIKHIMPKNEEIICTDLDEIVTYINSLAPFPQKTFKIAIEHKIDYIMFVKDDEKTLKKNYAYIWTDGKGGKHIEVKGLPIIKSTATELGQLILEKHIKPRMIKENKGKFELSWIKEIIKRRILFFFGRNF
jgi:DNA polymerase elongation subunit (family B)